MRTIPISDLIAKMSFGIYHATSIERYRDIRNTGRILPGNQVSHKNFPQSRLSNCHELGGVACFDFERADRAKLFCGDPLLNWPKVLLSYRFSDFPTTVLIGFDRSRLPQEPLYYPEIKRRLGLGGIIPYGIECCYPDSMELRLAQQIILVCHWNQTVLESTTEGNPFIVDPTIEQIGKKHKAMAEQYRLTLLDKKKRANKLRVVEPASGGL